MYRCEYCNRHLKKKYDNCPGCGGSSFKKVQNYGEVIIKEPPKDGYKINTINYKFERDSHKPLSFIGRLGIVFLLPFILVFIVLFIFVLSPSSSDNAFTYVTTLLMFIIFGCIIFSVYKAFSDTFFKKAKEIKDTSDKKLNKLDYLAKHGMLIKNLKYNIKPADKKIEGRNTKYKIQVIYEIEKGKTMNFESETKYLTALGRDDGTVDLLIDPNDYSNYFIDFEIY